MAEENEVTTRWRKFIHDKWKSGANVGWCERTTGKKGHLPGYYSSLALDWERYTYFLPEVDCDLGI